MRDRIIQKHREIERKEMYRVKDKQIVRDREIF